MTLDEYADMDAVGLAEAVGRGDVSPRETVSAFLSMVEAANPDINAVVRLAEGIHSASPPRAGRLAGVPVLLKDLGCPAHGLPTTFGSRLFHEGPVWEHDCALVRRLKGAGAVIAGRSAGGEFGVGLTTETEAFGATRNPYDLQRAAGGSSGGSAAAVAARITPLAHATDGCGSIRVPAAFCGLFGFKPGRARVSFAPDSGESWSGMSVAFGLVRSVRDAARLLDVLAGGEPGDPYPAASAPPQRGFEDDCIRPPEALRLGVVLAAPGGEPVHPLCVAAVEAAVRLCGDLGHEVSSCTLPFDPEQSAPHFATIWGTQLKALATPRYAQLGRNPDGWGMEASSWSLMKFGGERSAADHLAAVRHLHALGATWDRELDAYDVVVTPVSTLPPHLIGAVRTNIPDLQAYLTALLGRFPFTPGVNATGRPAMSVPLYWSAGGLPIGVQFIGKPGSEALLLRLARQLETAAPWNGRRPPQ
jgi:Asp-tRNA(Asn)/Glu-tRNA(Gln) amidotransferase A subunit family amidase